jgi:hypothetical protein
MKPSFKLLACAAALYFPGHAMAAEVPEQLASLRLAIDDLIKTPPFFPALRSTPPTTLKLRRPRRLPPSLKLPPSPEAMADKTADKTTGRPVWPPALSTAFTQKANS